MNVAHLAVERDYHDRVDEVRRFVDRVIEMRDGRVQRDVEVAEPQPERSVR